MSDPYQVLGVASTATDEEIKKAYRNLARKYHPDNYHDNPLADLAQERMKEINEAYEMIQSQRKHGSSGTGYGGSTAYSGSASQGGGYGGYGYGPGYGSGARPNYGQGYWYGNPYGNENPRTQRIRTAIREGNLNYAEEMLNAETDHDAEWYFLKGVIYNLRGWMDESKRHIRMAVEMAPDNREYQRALDIVEGRRHTSYSPFGGSMSTADCMSGNSCMRTCTTLMCCSALSGGGFCCFPF